jgi:DNA-binding protein H-NS
MEKKLRKKIQEILGTVTSKTAPNIYETIQAKNGYKTIEDMMIKMAINDNISLGGTISHIENML